MSRRLQYERTEGGWAGLAKLILVAAIRHPQSSPVRLPINVVDTWGAAPSSIMSALVEKLRLSFSIFVSRLFSSP